MSIKSGQPIDAEDHEKNIINSLEQAYQITFLSKDASVADKTYAYVESDITSDSNGFNNHIDTGNTTARFLGDRYVLGPGTIYDNFKLNKLSLCGKGLCLRVNEAKEVIDMVNDLTEMDIVVKKDMIKFVEM